MSVAKSVAVLKAVEFNKGWVFYPFVSAIAVLLITHVMPHL